MSNLWTCKLAPRRGFKGTGLQGDEKRNEKGIKTSISTDAETRNPSQSHFLIGNLAISNRKLMPPSQMMENRVFVICLMDDIMNKVWVLTALVL